MRSKTRTAVLSILAAIGAAALSAPAAFAQAGAPQDAAHGPNAQRGGPRSDMRARMEAMRQQHAAQRAQDLRTILRLRADQEPALTAFLASHKRSDHPLGPPDAQQGPMTTPQRLEMEGRREAEVAARRQKHTEALRTFYAALSPDQRQVFDALQRVQHGHGGRHAGHGFGGHGFGDGDPMDGPPGPWGRGDE